MATSKPRLTRRTLLLRAAIFMPGMYALLIGGTFTGMTVVRLQRISLAFLSITAFTWLIVVWRSPRRLRLGASSGWLIGAWTIAFTVSTIFSPSGRSMIALWYMAFYAGVWLLLSDLRQRGVSEEAFADLLVVAVLPLIFFALLQALPWFPRWLAVRDLGVPYFPARPVGTLGNPNLLGAFLALSLPMGVARMLAQPDRVGRGLLAAWCALVVGTLYLTYSRGAWLGAASGIGLLAIVSVDRSCVTRLRTSQGSRMYSRSGQLITLTAVIASVMALVLAAGFAWRAFGSPQRETSARLEYYALAMEQFAAHPWTGTGLFTFGRELSAAQSIPPEQPHAHSHNLVLNVATELGLPGLIALVLSAGWLVRELGRRMRASNDEIARRHVAASAAALLAIGVHSLVDMPLMAPALVIASLVALAAGVPQPIGKSRPALARNRLAAVAVTLLWIGVLAAGWIGALNYGRYVHSASLVLAGDYPSAMVELRVAADQSPSNALYRAEYAYAAGLAAGQGDRGAAALAVEAYREALRLEPNQALWWANLSVVQWESGAHTDALDAMRLAVAAAPDAADLWLNLGRYSEHSGDYRLAQGAYRRALQLAPRMSAAWYWNETLLRRVARTTSTLGPFPEDIARRQWIAGEEDEAIALLRATITRDPSQPRPHIEIGRLALESGQVERAERHLEAADVLGTIGADAAWSALLRAEIALLRGDVALADALCAHARAMVKPGTTGYGLMYGEDAAQFQFLSLTVPGKLLPQLVVLGPEPAVAQATAEFPCAGSARQ